VYRTTGNIMGFLTFHCDILWIYIKRKNGKAIQTIWFIISSTMLMTHCTRHRKRQKHVAPGNTPTPTDKLVLGCSSISMDVADSLICSSPEIAKFRNAVHTNIYKIHCFFYNLCSRATKLILILVLCTPHRPIRLLTVDADLLSHSELREDYGSEWIQ
jgi:hypothetical protein